MLQRLFFSTLLGMLLLGWITPALSAGSTITLLLSGDAEPYHQVVEGLRANLKAAGVSPQLRVHVLDEEPALTPLQDPVGDLLVSVGYRATRYALDHYTAQKIFATFVTRSSLLSLQPKVDDASETLPASLLGAVVLDQPATRLLALAEAIKPATETVGTVVNGEVPNRLPAFEAAARARQLRLQPAVLFEQSNPIADLKRVFSASDVFIVIPDKSRFNSRVAKWILFLSYRHRVPVIGYSQKYTDAGALVSIYSTPFQAGQDTGVHLGRLLAHSEGEVGQPRLYYPRTFTLSINDKVAQSLGINIEAQTLYQRLADEAAAGAQSHQQGAVFP